jgi:uncharacterized protein
VRDRVGTVLVGAALGASLHRIGLASWDEVHHMFALQSLRILVAFACAVALLAISWRIVRAVSSPRWTRRRLQPGTLPGGILFGVGWALCGACPSIVLVQLGLGESTALWTLAGVLLGNFVYAPVHARWFRWSAGSCLDD